jgi:hypothetical protein
MARPADPDSRCKTGSLYAAQGGSIAADLVEPGIDQCGSSRLLLGGEYRFSDVSLTGRSAVRQLSVRHGRHSTFATLVAE